MASTPSSDEEEEEEEGRRAGEPPAGLDARQLAIRPAAAHRTALVRMTARKRPDLAGTVVWAVTEAMTACVRYHSLPAVGELGTASSRRADAVEARQEAQEREATAMREDIAALGEELRALSFEGRAGAVGDGEGRGAGQPVGWWWGLGKGLMRGAAGANGCKGA